MDHAQIERISKALGDQTRLIIFEAIALRPEMNCSDIIAMLGVTPATVSHHLKTLADAGLIESRRDGQFVYNKSRPETMKEYTRSLAGMMRIETKKTKKGAKRR